MAATNADLEAEIKEGRFRADLYYRLNVLQIQVPPLRDRPDDIAAPGARLRRRGRRPPGPARRRSSTRRRSRGSASYPWPGNVRELRSVIERALVLHPGRGLAALDLAPEPVGSGAAGAAAGGAAASDDLSLRDNLNRLERVADPRGAPALAAACAGRRRACSASTRATSRYYCRKHGLDPDTLGD